MSQFAPLRLEQFKGLTDQSTLEFTVQVLPQHFDVQASGYCCQTRDLWHVLAAAQGSTIEATCRDLPAASHSNTVRGYLQDQLTIEQVRPLEADFNRALSHRALSHQLPCWLHRQLGHRGLEVAIDFA
jgi:hypothetical protein